jgi:hypothetical protein
MKTRLPALSALVLLGLALLPACRAEDAKPKLDLKVDGSALAAHHWAHSWMDSFSDRFQEDKVRDVLMLDQTNDQMAGDQTRIRGLGHEQ